MHSVCTLGGKVKVKHDDFHNFSITICSLSPFLLIIVGGPFSSAKTYVEEN